VAALLLFAVALDPGFAGSLLDLIAIWPFSFGWDDLSQISSITKTHVKSKKARLGRASIMPLLD